MGTGDQELWAINTAIEECQRNIEQQTDRIIWQTKVGLDCSTTRKLLFKYHRSFNALMQAKECLERRHRS